MSLLATPRGRRVLFSALYVSEGAPIGFLWWALPPKLRAAGVPVAEITALTALLTLPWTFKFVWAPLIDSYRLPRVGLRVWIIGAQLVMGATLLALLGADLARSIGPATTWLLLHAFAAATQDVAVDALAVETVEPAERGKLNAWTQTGMLGGRAAFGGGAILLEQRFGADAVLLGLCAVTWSSLALVVASLPSPEPPLARLRGVRAALSDLRHAFGTRRSWQAVGFALLGGAGFEAVGVVSGTWLVDRGADEATIGQFYSVITVGAMVAGSLIGGYGADRVGHARAVASALCAIALVIFVLCGLDAAGAPTRVLLVALGAVYLGIGVFVAASYALLMDMTDPRVAATQFSAYMGATNGCEVWSGWVAGRGVERVGYAATLSALAVLSLGALPLLSRLARATPRARGGVDASGGDP